jgi:hypothetical protein
MHLIIEETPSLEDVSDPIEFIARKFRYIYLSNNGCKAQA